MHNIKQDLLVSRWNSVANSGNPWRTGASELQSTPPERGRRKLIITLSIVVRLLEGEERCLLKREGSGGRLL